MPPLKRGRMLQLTWYRPDGTVPWLTVLPIAVVEDDFLASSQPIGSYKLVAGNPPYLSFGNLPDYQREMTIIVDYFDNSGNCGLFPNHGAHWGYLSAMRSN